MKSNFYHYIKIILFYFQQIFNKENRKYMLLATMEDFKDKPNQNSNNVKDSQNAKNKTIKHKIDNNKPQNNRNNVNNHIKNKKSSIDKKSSHSTSQKGNMSNTKSHQKFNECDMRIKQAVRMSSESNDIIDKLFHISQQPMNKEFLIPHVIKNNERRWLEFIQSSGRLFYTLKRDVSITIIYLI